MTKTKTPVEDAGATDTAAATAAPADDSETMEQPSTALGYLTSGSVPVDPVTVSPEKLAEAIVRGVDMWCQEHFFGTPISRATPVLNYLRKQAVPDLKAKILKEVF